MHYTFWLTLFAVFAFATPIEIDWSKVKPVHQIAQWRATFPNLAARFDLANSGRASSRIVGGDIAEPNQFPYHVLVLSDYGDDWLGICGGSIIGANYVLTAAHCIDKAWGVQNVIIVAGAHNFQITEPTQQVKLAYSFDVHEDWNDETLANDMGVVVIDALDLTTDYVETISLAPADSPSFEGELATLSGWGLTGDDPDDTLSDLLRFVQLPVISNAECDAVYGDVGDDLICTSGADGRNGCSGDSGGPLTFDGELIGVYSFGAYDGCTLDFPSGFSRVSEFRDWIFEKTGL